METDTKTTIAGIMGLIAILISGFGAGNDFITEDQFANAYVCDVTEEFGFFYGGLSGSEYRAYPTEGTTKGYKDCKDADGIKGIWIDLEQYAKDKGVNPMQFIVERQEQLREEPQDGSVKPVVPSSDGGGAKQVSCAPAEKCVPK